MSDFSNEAYRIQQAVSNACESISVTAEAMRPNLRLQIATQLVAGLVASGQQFGEADLPYAFRIADDLIRIEKETR